MKAHAIHWGTLYRVDLNRVKNPETVRTQIERQIGVGAVSLQSTQDPHHHHDVFVGVGKNQKVNIATGVGAAEVDPTIDATLTQILKGQYDPKTGPRVSIYRGNLFGDLPPHDSEALFTMTLPESETFNHPLKTETFAMTTGQSLWTGGSSKTWNDKPGLFHAHGHPHHPLEAEPAKDVKPVEA